MDGSNRINLNHTNSTPKKKVAYLFGFKRRIIESDACIIRLPFDMKAVAPLPFLIFLGGYDLPEREFRKLSIYHAQQIELLVVGFWLLWLIKKRPLQRGALENMIDSNYLTKRRLFAWIRGS